MTIVTRLGAMMNKTILSLTALSLLAAVGVANAGGQDTYEAKCKMCHITGELNSPKFGDKAAWAPRIATGVDALVASVKAGKNAMPPRGTCMECSDEDLRAAVEYMVSNAK